jgi:hypothetical protein
MAETLISRPGQVQRAEEIPGAFSVKKAPSTGGRIAYFDVVESKQATIREQYEAHRTVSVVVSDQVLRELIVASSQKSSTSFIVLVSMDLVCLFRYILPLAGLGLVTCGLSSLLVAGTFRSKAGAGVYCAFIAIFALVSIFCAYWRNASPLSRMTFAVLGLLDLIAGIASPIIPWSFHYDACYLNRTTYYMFLMICIIASISAHWHFATRQVAAVYLDSAGVDVPHESFLYIIWSVVMAFTLSFFVGMTESYSRAVLFTGAIVNTCGFWFLGAILAGATGYLVVSRGSSPTPVKWESGQVTPAPHAEYA